MSARDIKKTKVYQKSFELSTEIYKISKSFPKAETYSLTDQVRRSSRSVCINLGEAWRKRQYPAHFVAKISDADMENTETQIWIDFALSCGYITEDVCKQLTSQSEEIGKLLYHMLNNPDKY